MTRNHLAAAVAEHQYQGGAGDDDGLLQPEQRTRPRRTEASDARLDYSGLQIGDRRHELFVRELYGDQSRTD